MEFGAGGAASAPPILLPVLAHADVNFVSAGITFYANWHSEYDSPFFPRYVPPRELTTDVFCIFATTRSFALRDRGLKAISASSATTGRLVNVRKAAS